MIIPEGIDIATVTWQELVAAYEAAGLDRDLAELYADLLLDDNNDDESDLPVL